MFNDSGNGQTQYCEECQKWAEKCEKLKTTLKSVRGYFVVLENIIPTEMLSEGSDVFKVINDAKREVDEVIKC